MPSSRTFPPASRPEPSAAPPAREAATPATTLTRPTAGTPEHRAARVRLAFAVDAAAADVARCTVRHAAAVAALAEFDARPAVQPRPGGARPGLLEID